MTEKLDYEAETFPLLLKEIPHVPRALYVKGRLQSNRPHIAIVGTRKATAIGQKVAREFARELSRQGIVVVSGLAMGIDTEVHRGVIDAGGLTVAVLANGLDTVYPRQNERLAEEIVSVGGAIISEYPEGTPSYPNQFIERNRIISGLSIGVVIIEAPERSGALSTARFALEQNREVLVVPGLVSHPNYVGSHRLIKDGAALVASVSDILEALNIDDQLDPAPLFGKWSGVDKGKEDQVAYSGIGENEKIILDALESIGAPATIDELSGTTNIESRIVSRVISLLVIKSLIKEKGGRYFM